MPVFVINSNVIYFTKSYDSLSKIAQVVTDLSISVVLQKEEIGVPGENPFVRPSDHNLSHVCSPGIEPMPYGWLARTPLLKGLDFELSLQ